MLYSAIDEPELFDKNSPTVGHALVSSEYNEVIEMTLLVEEYDDIIEAVSLRLSVLKSLRMLLTSWLCPL